jgi:hypothetical protein
MNEGAAIYTTSIAPVSDAIAAADENSQKTASPIKHLLALIDENRVSDNVHSERAQPASGLARAKTRGLHQGFAR